MAEQEFWTWTVSDPTGSVEFARRAEAQGWDGIGAGDSQSLTGDPHVFLALAATASDTLGLATSVTNPVTRHAAATASSAIALQRLSGGRMAVGIVRGDSALAHLGRAPARLGWFEKYVEQVQAYLTGGEVPFEDFSIADEAAPPAARLGLADAPQASAIRWAGEGPKVPVEVAATGPRVIGIAARHADRVMLAVGADPRRIAGASRPRARRPTPLAAIRTPSPSAPTSMSSVTTTQPRDVSSGVGRRACSRDSRRCMGKWQARPTRGSERSFGGCTTATT